MTLKNCSKTQVRQIEQYRKIYQNTLLYFYVANPDFSVWSVSCSGHVYACIGPFYDSELLKVPVSVGSTVKTAVE